MMTRGSTWVQAVAAVKRVVAMWPRRITQMIAPVPRTLRTVGSVMLNSVPCSVCSNCCSTFSNIRLNSSIS